MSAYDDRLATLQDLARQALDTVVDIPGRDNQPYGEAVTRLERVLGYAVAVLDATDADLLAEPIRNELNSQFAQFSGEAQAVAQAVAANAEPWADSLLSSLAKLPLARDHDFAQLARDVAADYQRSVQERLNGLDAGFEAAQARVEQITSEADARRTVVSQEVDALKSSFEAKLAEYEQTLANERAANEQTLANERAANEQTKTAQAETFRAAQTERDQAFKATVAEAQSKSELLLASSTQEVEARVAEIRRMESDSAALVGAIGLAGTAERYGQEVIEQRQAADRWRRVTVVLAVLAAIGVVIVAITLGHNPRWEDFIGKLSASALIGGVAAYAARQSARHRQREERARNFQLELTAFSPFIEPLSTEQQEEERVVMTRKTFGKANTETTADEEPGPHPLSFVLRRKESEVGSG